MAAKLTVGKTMIEVVRGDITQEDVDAIVNAANSSLMGGGGVDGAIHRAGGPEILAECKIIVERQGRLPPGRAVITTAGNMPARHVIHTVGPIYSGSPMDPKTLASCYTESMKLADSSGLASVAFPAISCGVYGYPLDEAAEVSVKAVADYAREGETSVRLVKFVMFDARAEEAFTRAAESFE
ncbi:MAG: O-acetyl-ADP-ribose deacetylase [Planctomycetota bacterium]|jgi:O-acetyl-ADP-ribose deacetylase (regulator of RNase III)